jgi:hypothetical protein
MTYLAAGQVVGILRVSPEVAAAAEGRPLLAELVYHLSGLLEAMEHRMEAEEVGVPVEQASLLMDTV